MAAGQEKAFIRHRINGIENAIESAAQNVVTIGGGEKFLHRVDGALRINIQDALLHHGDLGPADGARQGRQLAVDIAKAHFIEVNERERSDAASSQRFHGPGADAANPNYRDKGGAETRGCGDAVQPLQAA